MLLAPGPDLAASLPPSGETSQLAAFEVANSCDVVRRILPCRWQGKLTRGGKEIVR